ncbi:zinc finger BED domain-containing protein 6 isoform X1 [Esox lucius]|uniref:HAT C-terminal dimerisation domain-containing protein n=1 Tax=Esox lucius TaxID=8010 RepID=A0A3P8XPJ3_ESOLU|nr:zinc finger BED domain-containing protein 6 isoform X1 [Esox lucius]
MMQYKNVRTMQNYVISFQMARFCRVSKYTSQYLFGLVWIQLHIVIDCIYRNVINVLTHVIFDTERNQEIFTRERQLSNLIVTSLQPLSILKDTGFKAFLDNIKPNILPKETYFIRKELLRMYTVTMQKVKKVLALADDIVLTSELWDSRPEESYMTVTSHFIDQQWNLNSYVLETTKVLGGPEQKADMVKQLVRIANTWEIKRKIHTVVTNMDGVRMEISKNGWTHIPCLAHTLDVVFKDVLKNDSMLNEVLRKCQKLVRFFHIDTEAQKELKLAQNERSLPHLSLIQSVGDGWLSCFEMLKILGEQYKAINKVLSDRQDFALCLSPPDILKINNAVAALLLFKELTRKMSDIPNGQRYSLISTVIPLVTELRDKIETAQITNEVTKQLGKQIQQHFRYLKQRRRLILPTALDPRFKNIIMSDVGIARPFLKKLNEDLQVVGTPLKTSDLGQILHRYTKGGQIPERENPLEWWSRDGSVDFVDLTRVARRNLGVVSTAIPPKRAFQEAENMIHNRRICLEPENINMILFLNSNSPNI